MINWIHRKERLPAPGRRVLVYSPMYEGLSIEKTMLFRIVPSGFVQISTDITYWAELEKPNEEDSE